VLVDIGQIPGVIEVLIGQHPPALSAFGRVEKHRTLDPPPQAK
jgi:hypothetical protein